MYQTGRTNFLDVDVSGLESLIREVREMHTKENYELVLIRAIRRTGTRARTIISKEIREDYAVPASWVKSQIGPARTGFGGSFGDTVHCTIPIDGARGKHGSEFKLTTAKGRGRPKNTAGKRYKIYSKVVKGEISELPKVMKNQGGNPPFIGPNGLVFTRRTKERLPIVRVVGEGVPQMPMNRSRDDIQEDILETLKKRIEHEHNYLLSKIAGR